MGKFTLKVQLLFEYKKMKCVVSKFQCIQRHIYTHPCPACTFIFQAVAAKVGLGEATSYFYLFETVEYNFGEFCCLWSNTRLAAIPSIFYIYFLWTSLVHFLLQKL